MELFKLFGKIAVDNTEANTAIDDTTKKAKASESETSKAFSKIGGVVGKAALGIGAAGVALGGAFVGAVEGTRDYRQQMGLLESAFQTAGHSTDEAKKTYSDLNAVMGDTEAAVEASQHLALIADNESELNDMTNTLTGVYSTFGASLPLEGLAEGILHSSRLGEVQGSLADALEWSGITVDDFNKQLAECSSEEERQDLITNTLRDTYGKAADQYKETNKDIMESRQAQERLTDAIAEVGRVGEPIMTAIRNGIASLAEYAAPALETMIEKIRDATTWVKENETTVKMWTGIILGAATAIGTFLLIMNWGTIMSAAASALKVVKTAVLGFNAALMANPIGIVVGLLAGLVVAFIYLWNNVDGFKQFWIETWEIIKKAASAAMEWIAQASSDALAWGKESWNEIVEWFGGQFDEIAQLGKDCMDAVSGFFSKGWEMAKNAWNSTISFFASIWSGIKANFSTVVSFYGDIFRKAWNEIVRVWNASKAYFQNIWKNIKLIFSVVKSVLSGNFSDAWNGIKKIWNNAKAYFVGIWTGIQKAFKTVDSWFGGIFSKAWSKIKSAFSGWGSFFSNLWTQIKNKFSSIGSTLGSTMSNAVKTGMNAIIGKIESTINTGLGLINKAIRLANKLGFKVGEVGELSLPRLEKGGVLKKGQVGILEGSGAEAVVPLERNTEWIDKVAMQMKSRMNNSSDQLVIDRLNVMISLLEQLLGMKIYLDSGALVGELTQPINRKLGELYTYEKRGNTR